MLVIMMCKTIDFPPETGIHMKPQRNDSSCFQQ